MWLQLVVSLFILAVTRILWRRWKYDLHKIPSPPALPIVGHALSILGAKGKQEFSFFRGQSWKKLGCPKLMKMNMVGLVVLDVTDMDFVKSTILSKNTPFDKYRFPGKTGPRKMFGNDETAKITLVEPGVTPYVKAIRKVYASGFQSSNMKRALPGIVGVMDRMIEIIESKRESGPIDFQEICVRMTLDTIGVMLFDTNLGGLDGSRDLYQLIIAAASIAMQAGLQPLKSVYCRMFPKSNLVRRQEEVIEALTAQWTQLTQEILDREDPPDGEEPIWYVLKNLIDPETERPIAHNSLVGEVATAVCAGMDTTGHQLAWILALLAAHPEVVDRLLADLRVHGLYGEGSRAITFDDLGELSYLTAIIKEGMRITHILSRIVDRVVPDDMDILGYRVPKDTMISVPGSRWLNSDADWGDADAFRPERWLGSEDHSHKYQLGFSYGPRDCVGQRLAMMELRLGLIHLLKTYKISSVVPFDELMKTGCTSIVIRAENGILLNVEPRSVNLT